MHRDILATHRAHAGNSGIPGLDSNLDPGIFGNQIPGFGTVHKTTFPMTSIGFQTTLWWWNRRVANDEEEMSKLITYCSIKTHPGKSRNHHDPPDPWHEWKSCCHFVSSSSVQVIQGCSKDFQPGPASKVMKQFQNKFISREDDQKLRIAICPKLYPDQLLKSLFLGWNSWF